MCHRDKLILITNQRGISRGKIAISDFLDRSKTKKFNQGNDFFLGGGLNELLQKRLSSQPN